VPPLLTYPRLILAVNRWQQVLRFAYALHATGENVLEEASWGGLVSAGFFGFPASLGLGGIELSPIHIELITVLKIC